jgi:DHA1 family tetracycline resistance protein-like MFS transporter
MPAYVSERFGALGQGSIMGLLTTTFCIGNVAVTLLSSVLILCDTRLILLFGGVAWLLSSWMIARWMKADPQQHGQPGHPVTLAVALEAQR